jgi:hypothetical protein
VRQFKATKIKKEQRRKTNMKKKLKLQKTPPRKMEITTIRHGRQELRDINTNGERPECRRRQRRRVSQEVYHDETMEKWEETNTYQTTAPSTHSNETCMNK